MSTKEVLDAVLRLLQILISWPVLLLVVVILIRRELPALFSKLSERITKAPGGFEFAALQEKVESLGTKVEKMENVLFEPSAALTPALQAQLQASVDAYQAYLATLGYQSTGKVSVLVDPKLRDNVYYQGDKKRIVLGEPLATDTDAVFREYTHHALFGNLEWNAITDEQNALESGLADYFPCSFNNDPLFGEKSIHLFRRHPEFADKQAIRDLGNDRKFKEASTDREPHSVGEIWGGAFWELRQQLGQEPADKILFSTWGDLTPSDSKGNFKLNFVKKLMENAQSVGEQDNIRAIFKRRGLRI